MSFVPTLIYSERQAIFLYSYLLQQKVTVYDIHHVWSFSLIKKYGSVLTGTHTRQCGVQLAVCKYWSSLINHGFVQGEANAAVECASICQSKGVLKVLDRPTGIQRRKLEADAGDAMDLPKCVRSVIDHLDFDKVSVKVLDNDLSVFHKSFANGHVTHDGAYASFLQPKDVGGDAIVSLQSEEVRGDVFVGGFRVFFDGICAVEKAWKHVGFVFVREIDVRTFFPRKAVKDVDVEVVNGDVLRSKERSFQASEWIHENV